MRELHQKDLDDLLMDETTPFNPEARQIHWLNLAKNHPPEWLASYMESPTAGWAVVTENGPAEDRQRFTAYLQNAEDLPFWAFALAKSYLDDVGEWPLFGMFVEQALYAQKYAEDERADPLRSVQEILAQIKPVWSDMDVIYVGKESYS
ncbi:MAG: hypothetical protein HQL93_09515 [Magnetococcales bacterium]|nr:hypothetical protein [Magnetococcales bacterium]